MTDSRPELGILLYTEPVLHKPTEFVNKIDAELLEQISQMLFIMNKNTGVGISANQVGISKRFCVVSLNNGEMPTALINPRLKDVSKDRVTMNEGCLSAPRLFLPVKRHKEVVVEFLNLKGEECEYRMTDFDARIIQHEIEHLDGHMITDSIAYNNFKF